MRKSKESNPYAASRTLQSSQTQVRRDQYIVLAIRILWSALTAIFGVSLGFLLRFFFYDSYLVPAAGLVLGLFSGLMFGYGETAQLSLSLQQRSERVRELEQELERKKKALLSGKSQPDSSESEPSCLDEKESGPDLKSSADENPFIDRD